MARRFFWGVNVSLTMWVPDKSQGRVGRHLPHLSQWYRVPSSKSMNIRRKNLEEISKNILLFVNISPFQMICTPGSLGSILGPYINQNSPEQPPHPMSPVRQREIRGSSGSERVYSQGSPISQRSGSAVVISLVKTIITVHHHPSSLPLKMRGRRAQRTVNEMPTYTEAGTPFCGTRKKRLLVCALQCP